MLLNGNCYELIKDIKDNTIDLIYVDIPYKIKNMNLGGGTIKRSKARENTHKEISIFSNGIDLSILDDFCRVLKKINIFIWCNKEQVLDLMNYFIKEKKCMYEILVWCKTNPTPFCYNTWLPDVEYCLYFREKGTKLNNIYNLKSKYYISKTNIKEKRKYKHPTIKPLELVTRHILHTTNENDLVLDCFMGSGTTGVACLNTNRNFIGIELNNDYFEIAKERILGNKENEEN